MPDPRRHSLYPFRNQVRNVSSDSANNRGTSFDKLPIRSRLTRLLRSESSPRGADVYLRGLRALVICQQTQELKRAHTNPLNLFGAKCFSQTDEDCVTCEILHRFGKLEDGAFAELGICDGVENNALLLKVLKWKGFWAGGQQLKIHPTSGDDKFCYVPQWITPDNIVSLARQECRQIRANCIDVISLDLDGNDIHFVDERFTSGFQPALFVVEYNAKFPPPLKWQISYDAKHTWNHDDYFGASIASSADLFERHNYRLVCCNSHSGANASFVKELDGRAFEDVLRDVRELCVPPRYQLDRSYGYSRSMRTVASLFGQ